MGQPYEHLETHLIFPLNTNGGGHRADGASRVRAPSLVESRADVRLRASRAAAVHKARAPV